MKTEILVALISFVGVIISVVVSMISSSRQTANDLAKLRTDIQQSYADKLLDRRLEVYPETYILLSDFMKKTELNDITRDDLSNLYEEINALNSKSSILFSGHTGSIAYLFRKYLREIIQQDDEILKLPETLTEIKNRVRKFELALKSDLGIYVVEFEDPSKRFSSYEEIYKSVDQIRKPSSVKSLRK